MSTPTVVFDGDCAFCTSSADRLAHWSRGSLTIVAWQHANLSALGLDETQCREAVQFVGPQGVSSGGAAITDALSYCALPWRAAAPVLRLNRGFTEWCYTQVAKNRHRLPGGTPACALEPRQP